MSTTGEHIITKRHMPKLNICQNFRQPANYRSQLQIKHNLTRCIRNAMIEGKSWERNFPFCIRDSVHLNVKLFHSEPLITLAKPISGSINSQHSQTPAVNHWCYLKAITFQPNKKSNHRKYRHHLHSKTDNGISVSQHLKNFHKQYRWFRCTSYFELDALTVMTMRFPTFQNIWQSESAHTLQTAYLQVDQHLPPKCVVWADLTIPPTLHNQNGANLRPIYCTTLWSRQGGSFFHKKILMHCLYNIWSRNTKKRVDILICTRNQKSLLHWETIIANSSVIQSQ